MACCVGADCGPNAKFALRRAMRAPAYMMKDKPEGARVCGTWLASSTEDIAVKFSFSPEQEEFRAAVRRFLADQSPTK